MSQRFTFQANDELHEVRIERSQSGLIAWVGEERYPIQIIDQQAGILVLRFGTAVHSFHIARSGRSTWVCTDGCTTLLEQPLPRTRRATTQQDHSVRSPMPAQVRQIAAQAGDIVQRGQTLLLLEAMKMEIRVQAPYAGKIERFLTDAGQPVVRDQVLVELTPLTEE